MQKKLKKCSGESEFLKIFFENSIESTFLKKSLGESGESGEAFRGSLTMSGNWGKYFGTKKALGNCSRNQGELTTAPVLFKIPTCCISKFIIFHEDFNGIVEFLKY